MDDTGPNLAYGLALCVNAGAYASVLSNLAFYVTCPEPDWHPDPDAFENATRGDVHREYRLLSKLARDPGLVPWLRRAGRDPVEFSERLESGKTEALSLISALVFGGVLGQNLQALGEHPVRANVVHVDQHGRWFRDLANALSGEIDRVKAERGADPEWTRPEAPNGLAGLSAPSPSIPEPDPNVLSVDGNRITLRGETYVVDDDEAAFVQTFVRAGPGKTVRPRDYPELVGDRPDRTFKKLKRRFPEIAELIDSDTTGRWLKG
ncbi:hypothetical protein [Tautonia marina]|uniref:hypothetical protein n=1 Tax=Tautonia marina TaxID=2653855 RepID=UPI00126082D6|nr:hypothetical protein [Tautonia marina]